MFWIYSKSKIQNHGSFEPSRASMRDRERADATEAPVLPAQSASARHQGGFRCGGVHRVGSIRRGPVRRFRDRNVRIRAAKRFSLASRRRFPHVAMGSVFGVADAFMHRPGDASGGQLTIGRTRRSPAGGFGQITIQRWAPLPCPCGSPVGLPGMSMPGDVLTTAFRTPASSHRRCCVGHRRGASRAWRRAPWPRSAGRSGDRGCWRGSGPRPRRCGCGLRDRG